MMVECSLCKKKFHEFDLHERVEIRGYFFHKKCEGIFLDRLEKVSYLLFQPKHEFDVWLYETFEWHYRKQEHREFMRINQGVA